MEQELTERTEGRLAILLVFLAATLPVHPQPYGEPDRSQPGDAMIQEYLRRETELIETNDRVGTLEDWKRDRPRWVREYYHMLGLWPVPERTPLKATVTRSLDRGDYHVDMVHYQSRPGLYVTANLYRPAKVPDGTRLPAILYVCGHSSRGRNGNKTAFQSHGIWFARHGYVCLMVDTLQLGEIAGIHHGTYRENRWWWLSRGYTPAGVECWNGVRGIDYLVSRPDVDPERIGVTGISGGGAATFWVAAADERVKAAAPVSGMADLMSYVPNRVINGHCDCMFLYNTYQWPWTRIAGLIAPRPLLFVNSDKDPIFPMDANDRVINRLERIYSLFGASDRVDSTVSIGGHDYRADIRQSVYRFFNIHLKNDPAAITDSEVDLVRGPRESIHPIAPEELRVFLSDGDIPADALNGRIDESFVPLAKMAAPSREQFAGWQNELRQQLRDVSFHHFPKRVPPGELVGGDPKISTWIQTEAGITNRLRMLKEAASPKRVMLYVTSNRDAGPDDPAPVWLSEQLKSNDALFVLQPRGTGETRWTGKNPPNYVERSHYLLGRTADAGRVWDIIATARFLRARHESAQVHIAAETNMAVLAAFAAAIDEDVAGLLVHKLSSSLMDPHAPPVLNALRVGDVPDLLGAIAPRSIVVSGVDRAAFSRAAEIYAAAGASDKLVFE